MKQILENYDLLIAMTITTAIAILLKCICAIIYQVLLREVEQITTTKNKLLRSMTTKFEACYQLRIPVHNPECFIKSYLERYRFLGISVYNLQCSDFFFGLIVFSVTLLSIMYGIYYEMPFKWILIHSMTLVLFLSFLFLGEFLFQVRHKKKILCIQLLNYFENTLQAKMENEYLHPEAQKAYEEEYFTSEDNNNSQINSQTNSDNTSAFSPKNVPDNLVPLNPVSSPSSNESATSISPDMQELIDSLLKESKIDEEISEKKEKLNNAITSEKLRLVEEIVKEYL